MTKNLCKNKIIEKNKQKSNNIFNKIIIPSQHVYKLY